MMRSTGECGNCNRYGFGACEVGDETEVSLLDVGNWTAWDGIYHIDDLFPHVTGGLRNRKVMVSTVEVRK